jgi:hypothetical protein
MRGNNRATERKYCLPLLLFHLKGSAPSQKIELTKTNSQRIIRINDLNTDVIFHSSLPLN